MVNIFLLALLRIVKFNGIDSGCGKSVQTQKTPWSHEFLHCHAAILCHNRKSADHVAVEAFYHGNSFN